MEKRNGEKPNEYKENRLKSEKKIECVNCGLELDPEEVEEIDGEPYCSFCAEEIELDRDIEEEWIAP